MYAVALTRKQNKGNLNEKKTETKKEQKRETI